MTTRITAGIAIGALIGCATSHERGFDLPIEPPASFTDAAPTDAPSIPDTWWTVFDDETLNQLQAAALADNFTLAAFRDRLRAARSTLRGRESLRRPTLDGAAFGAQTFDSDGDDRDRFGAGVIGAYDVDLWGRNAARIDSAAYDALVTREALRAAAIALSADVARTWYDLIEQRGQARVLDAQIRTNEQVLDVVRARFGGGVVRASDVLRQERLLESTREQRAAVTGQIDVLEHALLVLIGRSPTESVESGISELPTLAPAPDPGLPAGLVRRRPDLRAAFHAIEAADADVAVAVADRYPSVTIGFDASTVEDQVGEIFDDWLSVISIDVIGPLFDGGRRAAEVDRAEAVKAERINAYAQTMLIAFRQVVDAISRESARIEQIDRIVRQLDLAQRTSERLNREYLNGDISYIDVLDALTTEQQLQRDLLAVRLLRIRDRIDLHEALAGGWQGVAPAGEESEYERLREQLAEGPSTS